MLEIIKKNRKTHYGMNSEGRMMRKKKIIVNDMMQRGYVYFLTEPAGRNFPPDFQPELTPKEMLELGVFGGKYMTDCTAEFPKDWFKNAKLCHRAPRSQAELLRRRRLQTAILLAGEGLDLSRRSQGMVSMVLQVFYGSEVRR